VETALVSGPAGMLRRVHSVRAVELAAGDPADEGGVIRKLLTHHHLSGGVALGELALPAELVVNALGAWSPIFSAKIGVRDVTEPVRRQISLVDVREADRPPGLAADQLGMVVDASGLYFHPEGPHFLAGYSTPQEPPGYDFGYDGDHFFETEIWPRLAHRSSAFERCGHVRGWAGLYAVTPDCSGIAGRVGGFSNLFEAHSFTGRGVMQSYGIARNVAALVDTGRFDDVDLTPLARDRFDDRSRWVLEELHI
jgi:glycine/D-amino acid oxidase-like deaminating enzyme